MFAAAAAYMAASCEGPVVHEEEGPRLSVGIYEENLFLEQGDSYSLTLVITPSDAEYSSVVWETRDPETVTVSPEGTVTAVGTGEALVLVTVDGVSAASVVTVTESPLESVGFRQSEYETVIGETVAPEFVFEPSYADTSGVAWTSSDSSIVLPVAPGKFLGLSAGEAFVTAKVAGMSANCKVKVSQGVIGPGDFLFDDGTVAPSLLPGKYPVAVVFHACNPSEYDEALRAEHPQCTRGLAVSISENILSAWQLGYASYGASVGQWCDDYSEYDSPLTGTGANAPLNRICGYNNTRALLDFNSDFANHAWKVDAAITYCYYLLGADCLPEGTSGWYIPSAKEMSLLVRGEYPGSIWDISETSSSNLDIVNASIRQVDERCVIEGGSYWTSSEYDGMYAYFVNVSEGRASIAPKDFANGQLRFILAF